MPAISQCSWPITGGGALVIATCDLGHLTGRNSQPDFKAPAGITASDMRSAFGKRIQTNNA